MEDAVCRSGTFHIPNSAGKASSAEWYAEMPLINVQYCLNDGKYCFWIRNGGKYFFRNDHRNGYFSNEKGQKAASISS